MWVCVSFNQFLYSVHDLQLGKFPLETDELSVLTSTDLPGFASVCMLNTAIAKLQATLKDAINKANEVSSILDLE